MRAQGGADAQRRPAQATIDWDSPDDFGGLQDNYLVNVLANLTIDDAGTYMFRLVSDDGSELLIDDQVVIDHDGLHGDTAMDGSVTLAQGVHPLRINYFEATNGEQLTLLWRKPGESTFSVVPTSVLSTEAGVTRVTAPGSKQCEGQTDSAGDGLQLDAVNPAYDLTDLRPQGFEPQVTGLEWDGRRPPRAHLGRQRQRPGQRRARPALPARGSQDRDQPGRRDSRPDRGQAQGAAGHQGRDGDVYVSEKTGLVELVDADGDGAYEGKTQIAAYPFDGNFHEFGFGMLYDRRRTCSTSTCRSPSTSVARPPSRRARRTAARTSRSTGRPARSTTSPAASGPRTAWAGARTVRSS